MRKEEPACPVAWSLARTALGLQPRTSEILPQVCVPCQYMCGTDESHTRIKPSSKKLFHFMPSKCYIYLVLSRQRLSQLRHPDRHRARKVVHAALKKGKIQRPHRCSKCGNAGTIEAHHKDYSKPLDIEWLCRSCHYDLFPRPADVICRECGVSVVVRVAGGSRKHQLCNKHYKRFRRYGDPKVVRSELRCPHNELRGKCTTCKRISNTLTARRIRARKRGEVVPRGAYYPALTRAGRPRKGTPRPAFEQRPSQPPQKADGPGDQPGPGTQDRNSVTCANPLAKEES